MTSLHWFERIHLHAKKIKVAVFLFGLTPILILLLEFYNGELGVDPLDRITRFTGFVALLMLLVTLLITPARFFLVWLCINSGAIFGKRLADWNWMVRQSRMLGLFASFYASLHLIIYFWLDQGADWREMLVDVWQRPFVLTGLLAFILLIPVTVTSTDYMKHRLGENWRRIHFLVYPISILAVVHFWMLTKVGVYEPYIYFVSLLIVLGWRVLFLVGRKAPPNIDFGVEVPERDSILNDS